MIGQMRGTITLQAPTRISVGGGGSETTYTDVLTQRAKAEQVRSQIEIEAFKTSLGKLYRFTLRYRPGFNLSFDMLIRYNGRLFAVAGFEEVSERQRWWRITAVEKT